MTSSPGSMTASIVAIIASVDPQVTTTSRSGSMSNPRLHFVFAAMASRNRFAPQVIAYWLTSALTASQAARLMSSGAGKSGKPCDRLTAPWASAWRLMSRMTDSVKLEALAETRFFIDGGWWLVVGGWRLVVGDRVRPTTSHLLND